MAPAPYASVGTESRVYKRQPVRWAGVSQRGVPGSIGSWVNQPRRQKPQAQMPPVVQLTQAGVPGSIGSWAGQPQVRRPYISPSARERQIRQQEVGRIQAPSGTPEYDAALAVAQEQAKRRIAPIANRYATARLNQLQNVLPMLPPELQQQYQGLSMVDPAAAWRAISGGFSQAAGTAGYQDPRMYLAMLMQQRGWQQPGVPGSIGSWA